MYTALWLCPGGGWHPHSRDDIQLFSLSGQLLGLCPQGEAGKGCHSHVILVDALSFSLVSNFDIGNIHKTIIWAFSKCFSILSLLAFFWILLVFSFIIGAHTDIHILTCWDFPADQSSLSTLHSWSIVRHIFQIILLLKRREMAVTL